MQTWRAAAIACALGAALAAAPQDGTSSPRVTIVGRVVDVASDAPVPNARITAPVGAVDPYVAITDATGRFSLNATASLRDLQVRKGGYAPEQLDVPKDLSRPFDIRLSRSAAIAGRVVDAGGEPLFGVRVSISRGGQSFATRYTDDRGAYRVGGLAAGAYAVSVQELQTTAPREIYFPGVDAASAERLTLRPGDERTGVDFVLTVTQSPESAPRSSGTGVIRGRVVDSYGQPIARARLNLLASSIQRTEPMDDARFMELMQQVLRERRDAWSDSSGRFEFQNLLDADFTISAAKGGYVLRSNGALSTRVNLAKGQIVEGVELCLEPWASLEGRITDERGDPVEGAAVQLLRRQYRDGRRTLTPWDLSPAGSRIALPARTDERGQYRVFGLPPGSYVVSATIEQRAGRESVAYAATFYPGTVDPHAAHAVSVAAGASVGNIDLTIAPVRTARIAGRTLEGNGTPRAGGSMALVPDQGGVGSGTFASIAPDGSFEFTNVTPGRYVVQTAGSSGRRIEVQFAVPVTADGSKVSPARNMQTDGSFGRRIEAEFAAVPVTVEGNDVEGLVVQVAPASSISGVIRFNAPPTIARPLAGGIVITAVPDNPVLAPNALATTNVNATDLTFALSGVTGSRRLVASSLPLGWEVETVRVNGSNIGDAPILFSGEAVNSVEIVLTNQVGTITGRINDVNSTVPPSEIAIVAFAVDPQRWFPRSRHVRVTGIDRSGGFTIVDLPEGRYFVTAEPRLSISDGKLRDPEYLADVSGRASTVAVTHGTRANVDLDISLR